MSRCARRCRWPTLKHSHASWSETRRLSKSVLTEDGTLLGARVDVVECTHRADSSGLSSSLRAGPGDIDETVSTRLNFSSPDGTNSSTSGSYYFSRSTIPRASERVIAFNGSNTCENLAGSGQIFLSTVRKHFPSSFLLAPLPRRYDRSYSPFARSALFCSTSASANEDSSESSYFIETYSEEDRRTILGILNEFNETELAAIPKVGKRRASTVVNHRKRIDEALNLVDFLTVDSEKDGQPQLFFEEGQRRPFNDLYQLVHLKGLGHVNVDVICEAVLKAKAANHPSIVTPASKSNPTMTASVPEIGPNFCQPQLTKSDVASIQSWMVLELGTNNIVWAQFKIAREGIGVEKEEEEKKLKAKEFQGVEEVEAEKVELERVEVKGEENEFIFFRSSFDDEEREIEKEKNEVKCTDEVKVGEEPPVVDKGEVNSKKGGRDGDIVREGATVKSQRIEEVSVEGWNVEDLGFTSTDLKSKYNHARFFKVVKTALDRLPTADVYFLLDSPPADGGTNAARLAKGHLHRAFIEGMLVAFLSARGGEGGGSVGDVEVKTPSVAEGEATDATKDFVETDSSSADVDLTSASSSSLSSSRSITHSSAHSAARSSNSPYHSPLLRHECRLFKIKPSLVGHHFQLIVFGGGGGNVPEASKTVDRLITDREDVLIDGSMAKRFTIEDSIRRDELALSWLTGVFVWDKIKLGTFDKIGADTK